jgi:hypothetical protein
MTLPEHVPTLRASWPDESFPRRGNALNGGERKEKDYARFHRRECCSHYDCYRGRCRSRSFRAAIVVDRIHRAQRANIAPPWRLLSAQ